MSLLCGHGCSDLVSRHLLDGRTAVQQAQENGRDKLVALLKSWAVEKQILM
ncbi:unnamed protein product [Polarella glacialis]|uniref:Uncharacterized protein n=1 Tax=Polarella glacialis TaxID=89957 RepID=A0A813GMM3_POLGL|nr:unnamed protein product [Polarella glacialis]